MLGVALTGCAREPLEYICPDVAAGDLVITEVRGPQSGSDTWGEWIELYNASSNQIDLEGLHVRVRRIDGGSDETVIVRLPGVTVGAGSYTVLGQFDMDSPPDHVDYGYILDMSSGLPDSAAVEVMACETEIDQVIYRNLPSQGTWAFDGAYATPNAEDNDDDAAWCNDDVDIMDPMELGIPGTPGTANLLCP
jgi:hypothetical protein